MREKLPAAAVQGEPPGATQAEAAHHRGGEAEAHFAYEDRVGRHLVLGAGRPRFGPPRGGRAPADLVAKWPEQLVGHGSLPRARDQRPTVGSSRSRVPCSTTRYSPVSRSTISTCAAAFIE